MVLRSFDCHSYKTLTELALTAAHQAGERSHIWLKRTPER
jgi:hypothetical protein